MTTVTADEILGNALKQPELDRARIAQVLIASLDTPVDRENDLAWEQEINKRLREIDTGAVTCTPWEEAREQLYRNAHVQR
uniref:Putative addiction module component, TIGR02574 family n=1 Tax=Candidatus Kentrum sp. LFY TaxID=2126342 RepID=A0A450UMF3_9GAMM|nr:MAG: putative addiction module component, TIGR02574 family [Candidatus Kentron sp. LFY]VFJ93709.1 MAG: putative addiction module component, TIGR02574 family [Candidatus Kentron sp. LFY]